MAKQQSITSIPRSPQDDRHGRMIRYSITMGIRIVCIALCLVVQGWWLLICAVGAVVLPYIAVVMATSMTKSSVRPVMRPGTIVPVSTPNASKRDEP